MQQNTQNQHAGFTTKALHGFKKIIVFGLKQVLFLIVLSLLVSHRAFSQDEKVTIAILPFAQYGGTNDFNVGEMENTVTKEFVDRKRFSIVDRSKFSAVLQELNYQKDPNFINSSQLVEQGKQSGAQYLVAGLVTNMKIEQKQKKETVPADPLHPFRAVVTQYVTVYSGLIDMSFQIIDVTTGQAVYHENLTATSKDDGDRTNAMANTICHLQHKVRSAMLDIFPEQISILDVEEKDKQGLPKTVIINAGTTMFSESFASESKCDGGLILWGTHDYPRLTLFETTVYTAAGKEYKREKEVGELQVTKVEGETSICKVKSGEQAIQGAVSGSKQLGIKIKK